MAHRGPAPGASRNPGGKTRRQQQAPLDPELLTRTSWVDAHVAYRQVKKGRAWGNSCALWLRWQLQKHLFSLGCFVQLHSGKVLFLGLVFLSLCCIGLKTASIETNVEKLWVEEGGRLEHELAYIKRVIGEGSGTTHEIVIQTPAEGAPRNVLTAPSMLQHYKALQAATKVTIEMFDEQWKLKDLCYATNFPNFDDTGAFDRMMAEFIPCFIITPLDCFWEGSKLLGPEHAVYVPHYGPRVTWANLNPMELVKRLRENLMHFPQGEQVAELLKRAGISSGYVEKPCLDPSDTACPTTAPNWESQEVPDVAEVVTGGCSGFATKYMKWEEDLIIGGVHKNKMGQITRAEAIQSLLVLMGEHELFEFHKETRKVDAIDWNMAKAKKVLEAWQRKFVMEVNRVMEEAAPINITGTVSQRSADNVYAFSSTSLLDLLQDFSQISVVRVGLGYVLMLVYACITLMRWSDPVNSQAGIGVAGVLLVALSVAAGLGLCSVIGLGFNASTTQIIPFLALGLGVDDMFLIAHTFAEHTVKKDIPYHEQTGEVLKRVGVSVLLTSLSNVCAFFLAAIIPIPALRAFSLQVGVLILFNMVTMLVVFPAIISLDLIRRNEQKVDVFCCFTGSTNTRVIELRPRGSTPPPEYYEMSPPAYPGPWAHPTGAQLPGSVPCSHHHQGPTGPRSSSHSSSTSSFPFPSAPHQSITQTQADGSHPVTVIAPPEYDHYVPSNAVAPASSLPPSATSSRQCLTPEEGLTCKDHCARTQKDCCAWTLTRLAKSVYAPLLEKTCIKVFVVLGFLVLLILGIVGTVKVKDGLDITDVVPRGTTQYDFLHAQSQYFGFYNFYAVTQENVNYAEEETQRLLYSYHQAFQHVNHIIKKEDGTLPDFWLQLMRDWLLNVQEAFDKDVKDGCIIPEKYHSNATAEGILGYKLMVQTGDIDKPVDKNRVLDGRLVNDEGIIYPAAFYSYVTAWTSNDALAYVASQSDFQPVPREWYHAIDDDVLKIPKSQPFVLAQLPFYLHNMGDTEEVTATINEVRSICETFAAKGLPNFPRGVPFTFWEQYIHLRFYLMLSLLCVLAAIFLVLTVVLLNPWAAAIVVVVLAMMVVQLFGVMGMAGIKLSAVPAVILIMSVGIGVEFTVHLTLGFLTAIGSRNKRTKVTLQHMFAPVIHGAMTTLLGVIMLAGAEFDFIVRYFFVVLTALIAIGLFNGLLLLPVLLSIIGPNPEVVPVDGSDYLSPLTPEPSPPPPPRNPSSQRSVSRRVHPYPRVPSDISLTTITEEQSQYSSQESHISVRVHPEVVVETSVPGGMGTTNVSVNGGGASGGSVTHSNSTSSSSSRNVTPPESTQCTPSVLPRSVTTVKATARVKVEVHTPLPGAVEFEPEYKSKKRKSGYSVSSAARAPPLQLSEPKPLPPPCDTLSTASSSSASSSQASSDIDDDEPSTHAS